MGVEGVDWIETISNCTLNQIRQTHMETRFVEKEIPHVRGTTRKVGSLNGSGKKAIRVAVEFRVDAAGAQSVHVAGTFNGWDASKTPMVRKENGWHAKVELPRGRHEYRFVVDGQWMADPNAGESAPNPYGGLNSVVSI
jgi:1,4-alpha-glucan branching enzyme